MNHLKRFNENNLLDRNNLIRNLLDELGSLMLKFLIYDNSLDIKDCVRRINILDIDFNKVPKRIREHKEHLYNSEIYNYVINNIPLKERGLIQWNVKVDTNSLGR